MMLEGAGPSAVDVLFGAGRGAFAPGLASTTKGRSRAKLIIK